MSTRCDHCGGQVDEGGICAICGYDHELMAHHGHRGGVTKGTCPKPDLKLVPVEKPADQVSQPQNE